MEIISLISLIIATAITVVFIIMANNVSAILSTVREMKDEQQKIYKALYQIAKIQMDERKTGKEAE